LRGEAEAGARGLIWPSRYAGMGIRSWNAKWVFVDGKPKKKFHAGEIQASTAKWKFGM
ncbi:hypothetical protein KI387_035648, partial [Taxus chinensis]